MATAKEILTRFTTEIADAIRAKKGTSELIVPQAFSQEIGSISTAENMVVYQKVLRWDEVPGKINEKELDLAGFLTKPTVGDKVAYVSYTPEADCYYLSISKITAISDTTATITRPDAENTETLWAQTKSFTPTTERREITADDGNLLIKVIVEAVTSAIDSNITPTNIRQGVSILGIEGNLAADKPDQTKIIVPSTEEQVVAADTGFELASVTVEAIQTEMKSITPSTSVQNVTPTSGKYLSSVNVEAIPSEYIVPSGTKDITENGTVDVTQFASVNVAVPIPAAIIDVATASEMNAKLVAANVGKVYRFTGTTDATYTNGDLYEVVNE